MNLQEPSITAVADVDDDDGEIEFDQRFNDRFESRNELSKNRPKLLKKKTGRKVVSPADSKNDPVDASIPEDKKDESSESVHMGSISPQKRPIVDEDEQRISFSPSAQDDMKNRRKRIKRVASDADSDEDMNGYLAESENLIVLKPDFWED